MTGVTDDPRQRFEAARIASVPLINTSALAPSEIELEFAGVIVPSLANAGRSSGILSVLALWGCSSVSTTVSPRRDFTVTGAISAASEPSSMARLARVNDSIAKASICSLVMPRSSAVSWAKVPIARPV